MRFISTLALAFFAFGVLAQAADEKGAKKGDSKRTTWAVVKVADEVKVIASDKVAEEKKTFEKEQKEAEKAAKKAGKKAKAEPKKTFTVLKDKIATKEEAQKFAADYEKKNAKTEKSEKGAKGAKGEKGASKKSTVDN